MGMAVIPDPPIESDELCDLIIEAWYAERGNWYISLITSGNRPVSVYRNDGSTNDPKFWGPGSSAGAEKYIDVKCAESVLDAIRGHKLL